MINPSLFIGLRVRLTSFYPDDATVAARWYEDAEFARMFDSSPATPRSPQRLSRWLATDDRPQSDSYAFAIRTTLSDEIIGYADIDGIQWSHRTGWLGIGIGEPRNRGLGYGREAMELIMRFAFTELNLHRLQLTVFQYNERGIQLYERLGWMREGVQREHLWRDGRRWDVYLYGILAREWANRSLGG